jgi:hypothetical protein
LCFTTVRGVAKMEKTVNNTPKNSKQSINDNEKRIIVLEARKIKLNEEIEKLEKKTNKNLIEKTRIEHLKHELKSRSDDIDNHHRSLKDQMNTDPNNN